MTMSISRSNGRLQAAMETLSIRATRLLQDFKAARARRSIYTRTLSELRSLSDRELADLAIPRASIRRVALEESMKGRSNA